MSNPQLLTSTRLQYSAKSNIDDGHLFIFYFFALIPFEKSHLEKTYMLQRIIEYSVNVMIYLSGCNHWLNIVMSFWLASSWRKNKVSSHLIILSYRLKTLVSLTFNHAPIFILSFFFFFYFSFPNNSCQRHWHRHQVSDYKEPVFSGLSRYLTVVKYKKQKYL